MEEIQPGIFSQSDNLYTINQVPDEKVPRYFSERSTRDIH